MDGELQKLIKAAIENGAPFQFTPNVASGDDLSIHRLVLPVAPELAATKELFGDSLTIHVATSSHALLISVGAGGEKVLHNLVAPSENTKAKWLNVKVAESNKELNAKLGLQSCRLQVLPANQGFQVIGVLSTERTPTKLTSTVSEGQ